MLDEATSALDPKSEAEVQKAIECAENLLFFQSSSEIISAKKGSQLYSEILEKLKAISYAYGEDSSSDEDLDLGVGNFELN